MPTTIADLLNDYFENGVPYVILVSKYGRSMTQISRFVKHAEQQGRVRNTLSKDRRSSIDAEPLSRFHKRLGMRFTRWRDQELQLSTRKAAEHLGISINRYISIETGTYHITLLELIHLCDKLGWSLTETMAQSELPDPVLTLRKSA